MNLRVVDEAGSTGPDVIAELYQGEVLGEGLFNWMLQDLDDDRQRYVVGSMLQLETETKALLRQAAAMQGLGWLEKMARLDAGIRGHYLPRYELLASRSRPEDAQVTSSMVRHEAALLDVVAREAALT